MGSGFPMKDSQNWTGFQAVHSGFRVLDSGSFVSGTWIADSNRWWIPDSLSCIPYGIPKPRIPDSTAKICWIPESQFPYMGRKGLSTTGKSFSIFQSSGICSGEPKSFRSSTRTKRAVESIE